MLNINKSSNTGLTQTEGMNNASQTEIGKISPHQDTTKNKKENNLKKNKFINFLNPFKSRPEKTNNPTEKNIKQNKGINPSKEGKKIGKSHEPFFDTPNNFVNQITNPENPEMIKSLFEEEIKEIKQTENKNYKLIPWNNYMYQQYKKHITNEEINDYFKTILEKFGNTIISKNLLNSNESTMYITEIKSRLTARENENLSNTDNQIQTRSPTIVTIKPLDLNHIKITPSNQDNLNFSRNNNQEYTYPSKYSRKIPITKNDADVELIKDQYKRHLARENLDNDEEFFGDVLSNLYK